MKCTCKLYCIWITQLVAPCATFQQYFDTAFKSFKEQALRPAGPPYNCKITVFILTYNFLIWFVNWVICTILQWKLDGRKHQNQIFLVSVLSNLKSDTFDRKQNIQSLYSFPVRQLKKKKTDAHKWVWATPTIIKYSDVGRVSLSSLIAHKSFFWGMVTVFPHTEQRPLSATCIW